MRHLRYWKNGSEFPVETLKVSCLYFIFEGHQVTSSWILAFIKRKIRDWMCICCQNYAMYYQKVSIEFRMNFIWGGGEWGWWMVGMATGLPDTERECQLAGWAADGMVIPTTNIQLLLPAACERNFCTSYGLLSAKHPVLTSSSQISKVTKVR